MSSSYAVITKGTAWALRKMMLAVRFAKAFQEVMKRYQISR